MKDRPSPTEDELSILTNAGVPIVGLSEACRNCDDPCDEDSNIFDSIEVDYESKLLGSVKTAGRTVIVATGKADWPHSVTDEENLYAHTIAKSYDSHLATLPPLDKLEPSTSVSGNEHDLKSNTADLVATGVPPSSSNTATRKRRCVEGIDGMEDGMGNDGLERKRNISILCGSQRNYEPHDSAHDGHREAVMAFPDYKLVANLPAKSAEELVSDHISPRVLGGLPSSSSTGSSELQSFILPYYAVILICSHKRRDKRCHVTADPLIHALTSSIEHLGHSWHVDTHGNNEDLLESQAISSQDTEETLSSRLKALRAAKDDDKKDKHVGIFKVSHVGGHRYAGQVMIWFPNGVNVWYGRVRQEDCELIVKETLVNGRIITELLRGGLGIAGRQSILDW